MAVVMWHMFPEVAYCNPADPNSSLVKSRAHLIELLVKSTVKGMLKVKRGLWS